MHLTGLMAMISLRPDQVQSILCIGAHADDIEIGCGGTLLKLLSERTDIAVHWVVLSGNQTRAAEAKSCAKRFLAGAARSTVDVQSFQDASFPYADPMGLKDYFRQLSTSCSPDLIFTHRREDMHQDHKFVAELTWQHFRDHLIFEYEIPKYEGDLGQPSVFVPLAHDTAESKLEAIVTHFASQHDKPWFSAETLRALLQVRGVECQSPTGLAEAFYCRKFAFG